MSIWNLPLPVHMPEVHTPTPAPLAQIARTFGRYSRTLTEPEPVGAARVRTCACCGQPSTRDLRGERGWRGNVCRDCPDPS